MAIVLALGSLMCAAVNDIVFRLYARKSQAIGVFMACIGIVWAVAFSFGGLSVGAPAWSFDAWCWGLFSGVLSACANVLLIEAMARNSAGLCATIYRLNLAPAAILSVLLLGETLSPAKIGGLTCAVLAVLLVSGNGRSHAGARHNNLGIGLGVAAALLRAGMGVAYKAGLSNGVDKSVLLTINGLCWIGIGLLYHFLRRSKLPPRGMLARYGFASGILVCGIVWFMASALRLGDASIVLPVAQLSFLGTALIGWFLMKEHLTRRQIVGLLLAIVCIGLFAWA